MELVNTYEALVDYCDKVIERARKNLNTTGFAKRGRKINASGSLSKGLGYKVSQNNVGIRAEFTSKEDYAKWIEDGATPSDKKPSTKMIMNIVRWMRKKPIRLRSKDGRFIQKTPSNFRKAAYAIGLERLKKGQDPTRFFSEAMEYEFKQLPIDVSLALSKDLEDLIVDRFRNSEYLKPSK